MSEALQFTIGILFSLLGMAFLYLQMHCVQEQKEGRYIPLPWEKKTNKVFDKSDIEYTDGDNT